MKNYIRLLAISFIAIINYCNIYSQSFDIVVHIEELKITTDGSGTLDGNADPRVRIKFGASEGPNRRDLFFPTLITRTQDDVPNGNDATQLICNHLIFKNLTLYQAGLFRITIDVDDDNTFQDENLLHYREETAIPEFPLEITKENDKCKIKIEISKETACKSEEKISGGIILECARNISYNTTQPGSEINTELIINVDELQSPSSFQVYEQIPKGFSFINSEPQAELLTFLLEDNYEISVLKWEFNEDQFSDKELTYTMIAPDSIGVYFYSGNIEINDVKLNFTGNEKIYVSNSIPTLTQWGVAILTLLVLAIGMAFVYRRQASLALAGEIDLAVSNTKPVFFDWKLLSKVFAVMLFIGIMVLLLMYRFNGNITGADPAGIFVSAAIVAYMVHLWILRKPEKRQE